MVADFIAPAEANIVYAIIENVCEAVLKVGVDGQALVLHTRGELFPAKEGSSFVFEEAMSACLLEKSSDADVQELLQAFSLGSLQERLGKEPFFRIPFTVQDEGGYFILYEASVISLLPYEKDQGAADGSAKAGPIWILFRDITQVYDDANDRISGMQRAMKDAKHKIRQKNTFLSMLNRDRRTPLFSIIGLASLKKEDAQTDSALDSYLRKVSMSGTYMADTIDDILELRRISDRRIILDPEPMRLGVLLSNIESMMQERMRGSGHIFLSETDSVINLRVIVDAHCLQTILVKLLQSAIEYTAPGGRITLRAKEFFRSRKKATVEFSVESRGIIIDREQFRSMFLPYDYMQERINEDVGSLDTSLFILKNYAQAMGANSLVAEADGVRGNRVTMSLTMPLLEDAPSKKEKAPSVDTGMDFSGRRVLLVDDNEINREIGTKILSNKGVDVVTAENGSKAVEIFRKESGGFDMIFMDILMPEMDGLEASRTIRAMEDVPGAADVPIIAMTVNSYKKDFEDSFSAGMNAHLVKPMNPERIYAAMAEVLSGKEEGSGGLSGKEAGKARDSARTALSEA